MSYSIVRVSKVKIGDNGIQNTFKENNNYENEDIDHRKVTTNYDLVNANKQNFNNLIDEKSNMIQAKEKLEQTRLNTLMV